MDYSEETKQAYTVMQFQMVPGWFVFNGDGVLPPLAQAITAQQFNEALPNYTCSPASGEFSNSMVNQSIQEQFTKAIGYRRSSIQSSTKI